MPRVYKKKGSKKQRYIELFELAIPRLERFEVVLIGLEDGDNSRVMTDMQTLRFYWSNFKRTKLFLASSDPPQWLHEVTLTLVQRPHRMYASLYRKGVFEHYLDGTVTTPRECVLLTGRGASLKEYAPRVVTDPAALAFLTDNTANQEKWIDWISREKRDPMRHLDMYETPFDSPEAVEYRAKA